MANPIQRSQAHVTMNGVGDDAISWPWPQVPGTRPAMDPHITAQLSMILEDSLLTAAAHGNAPAIAELAKRHPEFMASEHAALAIILSPNFNPECLAALSALGTTPIRAQGKDLALAWASAGSRARAWLESSPDVDKTFKQKVRKLVIDLCMMSPTHSSGILATSQITLMHNDLARTVAPPHRRKDAQREPGRAIFETFSTAPSQVLGRIFSLTDLKHDSETNRANMFADILFECLRVGDMPATLRLFGREFEQAMKAGDPVLEGVKEILFDLSPVANGDKFRVTYAENLWLSATLAEHRPEALRWLRRPAEAFDPYNDPHGISAQPPWMTTSEYRKSEAAMIVQMSAPKTRNSLVRAAMHGPDENLMFRLASLASPAHLVEWAGRTMLQWRNQSGQGLADIIMQVGSSKHTKRAREEADAALLSLLKIAGDDPVATIKGDPSALFFNAERRASMDARKLRPASKATPTQKNGQLKM